MIVGIDSMVLIYAGIVPVSQTVASDERAELGVRAKMLLRKLAAEKADIVLATVAISELLVPVPSTQHGSLIAELKKRFICQPHDLRSAALAAELWSQHKKLPKDQQYESRHVLKSDAMIVAAAKAAGATYFYSHDAKCRTMADLETVFKNGRAKLLLSRQVEKTRRKQLGRSLALP